MLLQRLRKKPAKKFYVEIAFPKHTVAIVYDRNTYVDAIFRVYNLWRLDDGNTFSFAGLMQAISWIEISIQKGG